MLRISGPPLGSQGSHWRSWRQCSLELGTQETSPSQQWWGGRYFNHLPTTCHCMCGVLGVLQLEGRCSQGPQMVSSTEPAAPAIFHLSVVQTLPLPSKLSVSPVSPITALSETLVIIVPSSHSSSASELQGSSQTSGAAFLFLLRTAPHPPPPPCTVPGSLPWASSWRAEYAAGAQCGLSE